MYAMYGLVYLHSRRTVSHRQACRHAQFTSNTQKTYSIVLYIVYYIYMFLYIYINIHLLIAFLYASQHPHAPANHECLQPWARGSCQSSNKTKNAPFSETRCTTKLIIIILLIIIIIPGQCLWCYCHGMAIARVKPGSYAANSQTKPTLSECNLPSSL